MRFVREKAWAKLNLGLNVLGALPDGYHEMEMIMQSCSLYDDVRVTLTDDGSFRAQSNLYYLPNDERNICVKAAKLFFEEIGESKYGVRIDMKKTIPIGAGMAGGSSDCAATLRGLNKLTKANFSADKLRKLGIKLGADVPFCIEGGTCLAKAKGEELTKIAPMPDCYIVICKPKFSISTPSLFAKIDDRPAGNQPDIAGIIKAMEEKNLKETAEKMANVFEDVLPETYSEIFDIKAKLMQKGALGALMTGTGSAVFGVFESKKTAEKAKYTLAEKYKDTHMARPR